jgi:NAD(P)-dependent dehydrogenase (short-subunit alcohol dehydrogenase family)
MKSALVTGGARRVGAAICDALAARGWKLWVHYRNSPDEAEALARRIGGETIQADLQDRAQISSVIERTGPVHALVNNASLFQRDLWDTVTPETWDAHLNANLLAPLLLSQAMAKALPADEAGCIVNLIDQRVWKLTPDFLSYTVSKSALWTLTRSLAQALAPRIRVNAVGPGPVLRSVHQRPDQFATQAAAVPLQKSATPEEIAAAVIFLLEAPSVTGQMIAVDGGQHLAWQTPDVVGVE